MSRHRRKLIEVSMPLDAISVASVEEKSVPRRGHPQGIHLWWARRPLAAVRGVLFSQLVTDPSEWPEEFVGEDSQAQERARLSELICELVRWENSSNSQVLDEARTEIARSLARERIADGECDELDKRISQGSASPEDVSAYLLRVAPRAHDPFSGGGSIPLEAQRLGLAASGTDLNPVAVLVTKALIDIPARFAGRPPVGPRDGPEEQRQFESGRWHGPRGLSEDVRRYGLWVRDLVKGEIGHLYPDSVLANGGRPTSVPTLAWIWARTVKSPNPAFHDVDVPLVRSFVLTKAKSGNVWIDPIVDADGRSISFVVRTDSKLQDRSGTVSRSGAVCLVSGDPIPFSYIRSEAKAGRLGTRLMAVAAQVGRRRVFLSPTDDLERLAESAQACDVPDTDLPPKALGFRVQEYGMTRHRDLFSPRQLAALSTFADMVSRGRRQATADAVAAGWSDDGVALEDGGREATAYGDAVATYLTLCLGRLTDYNSTICTWNIRGRSVRSTFARHALPMTWDFYETNPLADTTGSWVSCLKWVVDAVGSVPARQGGSATQQDAADLDGARPLVICTDPPYYDNIGYADLSDFFYVWHRLALRDVYPKTLSTVVVPKSKELIATPYRHDSKAEAEQFFLAGMTDAMRAIARNSDSGFPITIFYAFKQSETRQGRTASTGWESFLNAVLDSGLAVVGTWPIRTERNSRNISIGTNALASSIVLVCRRRSDSATAITRGDFLRLLRKELPSSISRLQKSNIAPVDVAQASIGPGMAVFSRHRQVIEADGSTMSVRSALELINEVMDEIRGEQESDLDRETRFGVTWYETHGHEAGPFGDAETLAKARNVSVAAVQRAGLLSSSAGRVRLLRRDELPADWDPSNDSSLTVWECTQHLIKRLEEGGDDGAATLLTKIGPRAEQARTLAYRLYTSCERSGRAEDARAYNGLVVAWPELKRLSAAPHESPERRAQGELF